MADTTTITKNPALSSDEDYAFLRSAGLQYIEELSSDLWTDYNEHDPGITILEALCYAITELGYRAHLPMVNLLTESNGQIASSQALFTAKNIFTQAPLTIDDYRKLLIDIDGIHNAWLLTNDTKTNSDGTVSTIAEVPFYADCKNDKLTYETTPHPIYVSGLYTVLLDLDDDPQVGSLNDGEIELLSPATTTNNAGAVSFTVIFPAGNDAGVDTDLFSADKDAINNVTATITQDGSNWTLNTSFSVLKLNDNSTTYNASLAAEITIDLQLSGRAVSLADMQAFFSPQFTQQVITLYIYKLQQTKKIVQTAIKILHENRNLCEDFIKVDTIPDEEIAICCDIDVTPDTDMDAVQADVWFAIEQYLNPSVNFYLLKDLLVKGYTPDEVFEGPRLAHGFIDTTELENTQLKTVIHASDIISLIMNIQGVLAVKNFRMTKYDANGNPVANATGKSWCMNITPGHKPVFYETASKILFYKNNFPYLPNLSEVRDTLNWLKAVNAANKLTGHADDLPLPIGQYNYLEEYTSIDELFPQTYGIGNAGLPSDATEQRKAQAKQMKAYLLFYDQLLADFFSELKNAKALFSTDSITHTYFGQYIDSIKDVDAIYKQDSSHNSLLEAVFNNADSSVATPNGWQSLYESNETFTDRRTRFLDHLMARFAESFNDYVLLMYSLDYDTQQETKIDPADVINNKIDFIKNYPQTSYERAKAFNYFPQTAVSPPQYFAIDTTALWDTDNVSGLEKKAARLAGISNVLRRFLFCFTQADVVATTDTPAKYQFVFTDENNNTITSFTAYQNESGAVAAATSFVDVAKVSAHYSIEADGSNQHIVIKDDGGNTQAISNDFADEATALTAQQNFITLFNAACDSEGMHLIEHILLRPRNNAFVLPPVCLTPGCDFCGEEDPFLFRITVLLPYWSAHFQSLAFRDYFENMIRSEAPAHTLLKVCWLNNDDMRNFEIAYKNWLTALANYAENKTTITALQTANDTLINILFYLHSEYPVATLHDCEDSENTNPVMLGRTILGSFKPQ